MRKMDTSKEYIKMCDCPEIQIPPQTIKDGDYYWWSVNDDVCVSFTEGYEDYIVHHPEQWDWLHGRKIVFLPRQDQLQEMIHEVREKNISISGNHGLIIEFAYWVDVDSRLPCASMEQLWLAFVMKAKFNKIWSGSEWINEKER